LEGKFIRALCSTGGARSGEFGNGHLEEWEERDVPVHIMKRIALIRAGKIRRWNGG